LQWSRADRETVVQSHFCWFQCKKHLYLRLRMGI
jgi:hypothetical protein